MNTIRNIEGATIITISALCVAAVLSIAVQTAHAFPAHKSVNVASATPVMRVEIVGKRLTAAEKTQLQAELRSQHVSL